MEGVKWDSVLKRLKADLWNLKYSPSSTEYNSQYFVGVSSLMRIKATENCVASKGFMTINWEWCAKTRP
jgi:hypothetical protein